MIFQFYFGNINSYHLTKRVSHNEIEVSILDRLEEEKHPSSIRAVERALNILSCFHFNCSEMNLGEIAKAANLSKSTAFRLLVTMEGQGFIQQDRSNSKYSLGPKLFYLGSIVNNTLQLRKVALIEMEELSKRCRETVTLNVEEKGERVVVEAVEGLGVIRNIVHVGLRHALHVGATGKVLLAYKDKEFRELYIQGMDNSETAELLRKKLNMIRQQGYVIAQDEGAPGSVCMAAPIFDRFGDMVAALAISGTTLSLSEGYWKDVIREVVESAHQISCRLGWPGPRTADKRE